MTNRKLPERTHYVVVCKNRRQAYDLFSRTRRYYQNARRKHPISVRDFALEIAGPLDSIKFVPERGMCDMLLLRERINCTLISADLIDKRLDKLEKEK